MNFVQRNPWLRAAFAALVAAIYAALVVAQVDGSGNVDIAAAFFGSLVIATGGAVAVPVGKRGSVSPATLADETLRGDMIYAHMDETFGDMDPSDAAPDTP